MGAWTSSLPVAAARLAGALALALLLIAPAALLASPLDVDRQPAFTPRTFVAARSVRIYADPSAAPEQTGLNHLSLVDVHRRIRRTLREDPRWVEPIDDVGAFLLGLERDRTLGDLATLARQASRLGIAQFRTYQMATAVDELESALATFARTPLPLSDRDVVAETHFYLALASLELGRLQPEEAVRHQARARRAFREVVRLDPTREVTPSVYPSAIVDAWRAAYAEHFVDGGAGLGMSPAELQWLGEQARVDAVVDAFVLVDSASARLRLRVWSRARGAFLLDTLLPIEPVTASVRELVERKLLGFIECLPLLPPATFDDPTRETGRVYLSLGGVGAIFLNVPTRGQIAHLGAAFGGTWTLTETFAVGVDTQLLFSQRDALGDLVNRIDTVRTSVHGMATGRWGRWRLEGGSGVEVTRVSSIRATSSFWCRVSGGRPTTFDEQRICRESDVTRSPGLTLLGVELRARALVQVIGPMWLHAGITTSLYVLPFDERVLDFPYTVTLGTSYRF